MPGFDSSDRDVNASNGSTSPAPDTLPMRLGIASPSPTSGTMNSQALPKLGGIARRTLGISLLLVTVFLWTLSNFLASTIFADETYDKPFFLLYVNTSVFAVSLLPNFIKYASRGGLRGLRSDIAQLWRGSGNVSSIPRPAAAEEQEGLMAEENFFDSRDSAAKPAEKLTFRQTMKLSLEFCAPWCLANYLASACLEFTSVASSTILGSTSSIWVLALGAMLGTETFSMRKLIGVVASVTGVMLISMVDLSGDDEDNRGSFPHKTPAEIALGDIMALMGAFVYGVYAVVMKRRVGSEDRVDMRLFFGLVGFFNFVLLWPLFFILHWTGIETFALPPTGTIWGIILVNALASFVSDVSWAFAMLLTTPLVVTVGLSLTIPLSLIGEMLQYGQYSSFLYWVGAVVVVASFLFINHESHEVGDFKKDDGDQRAGIA